MLLKQVADDLGAFSVGKSSAVSTLTLPQVKKPEDGIAMMRSAVGKRRASSKRISARADIIHTVVSDGDFAFTALAKSEFVVLYVFPFSKNEWTLA